MSRCEQCSMYRRRETAEAAYSVTITGNSRDVHLCGQCLNAASVAGDVVGYEILHYDKPRKPFSRAFWIIMVPTVAAIVYLIDQIWEALS